MGLNIKNGRVIALVKELARREGVDMTEAIRRAVQRQLQAGDDLTDAAIAQRLGKMREIEERVRSLPVLDDRPADDLLGYNAFGSWE